MDTAPISIEIPWNNVNRSPLSGHWRWRVNCHNIWHHPVYTSGQPQCRAEYYLCPTHQSINLCYISCSQILTHQNGNHMEQYSCTNFAIFNFLAILHLRISIWTLVLPDGGAVTLWYISGKASVQNKILKNGIKSSYIHYSKRNQLWG